MTTTKPSLSLDEIRRALSVIPCTYFIGGDVGAIKIGRTRNIIRRLAQLQSNSPIPLHVLGLIRMDGLVQFLDDDPPTFEVMCHRAISEHRLWGEWFERDAAARLWRSMAFDHQDFVLFNWDTGPVEVWELEAAERKATEAALAERLHRAGILGVHDGC